MFEKIIKFIKYNNAVVLILAVLFLASSGVWAQTEAGQEFIGAKQVTVEGVDNTLLLEVDLDTHDMDFNIELIKKDENYYYVTYTYLDIQEKNNAWQYQMQEGIRKISLNLKKDLGEYLAEELGEEYEARIKELKKEKTRALEAGEELKFEVTEYTGLIGQSLELASRVFNNYEPIKKRVIPSPSIPPNVLLARIEGREDEVSLADDLTDILEDYVNENDPDCDDVFNSIDNCPNDYNPDQDDRDEDGLGDVCDPYPDGGEPDLTPPQDETATTIEEILDEPSEDEPPAPTDDSSADVPDNNPTDVPPVDETPDDETPADEPPATEDEPDVEIIELPVE